MQLLLYSSGFHHHLPPANRNSQQHCERLWLNRRKMLFIQYVTLVLNMMLGFFFFFLNSKHLTPRAAWRYSKTDFKLIISHTGCHNEELKECLQHVTSQRKSFQPMCECVSKVWVTPKQNFIINLETKGWIFPMGQVWQIVSIIILMNCQLALILRCYLHIFNISSGILTLSEFNTNKLSIWLNSCSVTFSLCHLKTHMAQTLSSRLEDYCYHTPCAYVFVFP